MQFAWVFVGKYLPFCHCHLDGRPVHCWPNIYWHITYTTSTLMR